MPRHAALPLLLSASLLCLAAARASALLTEKLQRFSPAAGGAARQMEVVSGVASVLLAPAVSTSAASAALLSAGFRLDLSRGSGGWHPVAFLNPVPVASALASLKAMTSVVADAEPDKVYSVKRAPNDPQFFSQYAMAKVQAIGAWEYETGFSSRVTVAVIDTGIDSAHPDLAANTTGGFVHQFCDPGLSKVAAFDDVPCAAETPPVPACFHGTAVAGVAGAMGNNAVGMAGMSWGAQLLSMRVFRTGDCSGDCGNSGCETDDWAMANALNFLAGKQGTPGYGNIVANLSLGCPVGFCGSCSGAVQAAVTAAKNAGVLIFAAAGNGGDVFIDTPADCDGVKAVGATDEQDKLAYFSSTDSTMTYKGVTAPGLNIFTTTSGGGYTTTSGTSFSSPLTAGLAALVWSAKPAKTAPEIWDYIKNSADDLGPAGPDRSYGWGRVNAYAALCSAVGCPGSAPAKKAFAYPNPFRPKIDNYLAFKTSKDFDASGIEVTIYTAEGELVKKLPGLIWDGKNETGRPVVSGVYLFRVKADKDSAVGKFALLR